MGNDKLLRTDFIRLKNMLIIFKRRYIKTNDESISILLYGKEDKQ